MNKNVDTYFTKGCGRCSLYDTPACKVLQWQGILKKIRELLVSAQLNEESKWGSPCYTLNGGNVAMIQSFKGYCALMFFKGSLLKDPNNILVKAGENSNSARQIRVTDPSELKKILPALKTYIKEAIQIEKDGLKVEKTPSTIDFIPELKEAFKQHPSLKKAFVGLTPGRQRGYHLFFSQAKQSSTRVSRIEKYISKILSGKGMMD
jgi:hypothetical protein